MEIVVVSDEARFRPKVKIEVFLESNGHEIVDYGIRNQTSGLTMGARVIGSELSREIVVTWVNATCKYRRSIPEVVLSTK